MINDHWVAFPNAIFFVAGAVAILALATLPVTDAPSKASNELGTSAPTLVDHNPWSLGAFLTTCSAARRVPSPPVLSRMYRLEGLHHPYLGYTQGTQRGPRGPAGTSLSAL